MDQKPLLGMSINCGWFVKKSFVLPTLCTSLLLLIAPLYGLININCQYLALMSCKKSHFEICHLKYITSFDFGHLNFFKWNNLLYGKIQSKPKGLYLYIS